MVHFIRDDGGRADAGYKGATGDCGCRAIAIATGMPYQDVYDMVYDKVGGYSAKERMTKKVRNRGRSSPQSGIWMMTMQKVMRDLGWKWVPTMKIGSGCKVHLRKDELPNAKIIVRVSKHYAAVLFGFLHDTYDCSRDGTRCVYGYWIKA